MRRFALLPLALLSLAAVIGTPSVASAGKVKKKTYSIKMVTSNTKQDGAKVSGKIAGRPFGKCTFSGKLVIPKMFATWKCRGGTIHYVNKGTTGAANDAAGTWVIDRGTGKFKGITGKGTFTGLLSTGVFTNVGRVSY